VPTVLSVTREGRFGSKAAVVTTFATGRLNIKKQTCFGADANGRSVPRADVLSVSSRLRLCSRHEVEQLRGDFGLTGLARILPKLLQLLRDVIVRGFHC
jgi:hypothetical protein